MVHTALAWCRRHGFESTFGACLHTALHFWLLARVLLFSGFPSVCVSPLSAESGRIWGSRFGWLLFLKYWTSFDEIWGGGLVLHELIDHITTWVVEDIKRRLATTAVLTYFQPEQHIQLFTDAACTTGFGFAVLQLKKETREWKPIIVGSRALTDAKHGTPRSGQKSLL